MKPKKLDRLFTEFDPAYRLRSFKPVPGSHLLKIKMAARNSIEGENDLIYSLQPATLQFEAVAGHTYQPRVRFDRKRWITWTEDKDTGVIVATT